MKEMEKPLTAYFFGMLFLIVYLLWIVLNIWILKSPNYFITNAFNIYFVIILGFVGFISSIILLISRKHKTDMIGFYGISIVTMICFVLNIIAIVTKLELGINIFLNLILFVLFGLNNNFRIYFDLNKKNK